MTLVILGEDTCNIYPMDGLPFDGSPWDGIMKVIASSILVYSMEEDINGVVCQKWVANTQGLERAPFYHWY